MPSDCRKPYPIWDTNIFPGRTPDPFSLGGPSPQAPFKCVEIVPLPTQKTVPTPLFDAVEKVQRTFIIQSREGPTRTYLINISLYHRDIYNAAFSA